MKVLIVSESYYPLTSGVPVVVRYLAEGLFKRGHNVTIATKSNGNPMKKEILNGVDIYRFDIIKNFLKFPSGKTKQFVDFVLTFNADVTIVECTQCITTDLLLPHLNKIKGKKFLHVHGISGLTPGRKLFSIKSDIKHTVGNTYNFILDSFYFKYVLNKAIPLFNATMCLSKVDYGIEYLEKYSRKNYILDNAADNMFFDDGLCKNNSLYKYTKINNPCYFVSCANYTYIKNQLNIINQYYLSESSKSYSLICIGSQSNDYYKQCVELVGKLDKQHGKRNVHLLYGVDRNDIPSIINGASLYLVGSLWEQYSISIIEAMSRAVPFISTDVGNARILPGGKTIDSIDIMHLEIDNLLNNQQEYNALSQEGKKFAVENCRIDVAVQRLNTIINE